MASKLYRLLMLRNGDYIIPAEEDADDEIWNMAGLWQLFWGQGENALSEILKTFETRVPEHNINRIPEIEHPQQPKRFIKCSVETMDVRRHPQYQKLPDSMRGDYNYLLPCNRNDLVVLDDYKTLYARYSSMVLEPPNMREHVVLSGHPGVGKSFALQYFLVRRVCEGLDVGLQPKQTSLMYMFCKDGVRAIPTNSIKNNIRTLLGRPEIWWLADELPASQLFRPHPPLGMMIIAASPATAEFSGKKELRLSQLYIDVWSWPEISAYWEACQQGYGGADDDEEVEEQRWLLWCAYARYGGVARLIFDKLRFGDRGATTGTILGQISQWDFQVTTKAASIAQVQVDVSVIMWPETTTHQVITTRPMAIGSEGARMTRISVIGGGKSPIEYGYMSGCGTAYVLKIVFLACKKYQRGRAKELFQQLGGEPNGRTYLGNLFESLLHEYLSGYPPSRPMRRLGGVVTATLPGTRGKTKTFRTMSNIGELLRAEPKSQQVGEDMMGVYLRPTGPTFPAIDGLYVTAKPDGGVLINLLQMTVAADHTINLQALIEIVNALPAAAKKWHAGCELRFIFMTLSDVTPSYDVQAYTGSDGKVVDLTAVDLPSWWPQLHQFVIGYGIDELFESPAQAPVDARGDILNAVPSAPQEAITPVSDETDTNQDGAKTRGRKRAAPLQSEPISGQSTERLRTRTKKNYIEPATSSPSQTEDEDSNDEAQDTHNRKQAAPVNEPTTAPRKRRAVKKIPVQKPAPKQTAQPRGIKKLPANK